MKEWFFHDYLKTLIISFKNKYIANNFSCIKKRIEYILKEQKIKESNNVKNKNSQSKEQKKKGIVIRWMTKSGCPLHNLISLLLDSKNKKRATRSTILSLLVSYNPYCCRNPSIDTICNMNLAYQWCRTPISVRSSKNNKYTSR